MKLNKSFQSVNKYLEDQANLDTVRFITCGSVDDGKSTLIGCMLYETKKIFTDQIESLKEENNFIDKENKNIDFASLVDGLLAEKEQGITIDVAYRYFSTIRRKFIIADTPGHEEYTRNMVTGASTADIAIMLVDATKGLLEQTRRHLMICSIIGVKKILLAVNKMDLVNYSEKIFENIKNDFNEYATNLNDCSISAIPISALKGDNVIACSKYLNWFSGPTLMGFLETVDIRKSTDNSFRFPVQWVNRPNMNFRGFSGTIVSGSAKIGQKVRIYPSGERANIKEILFFKKSFSQCDVGKAVTIRLDREVDVSRGDVIVNDNSSTLIADHFEIKLVWMDKEPGYAGRTYLMKLGTLLLNAQITEIKNKININTYEKLSTNKLEFNDISTVTLKTEKRITYEKYKDCSAMGGLILIDRMSNQTVAAGMISFALRRSNNLSKYKLDINKDARQVLSGHSSKVIWFTGLSGSGKSTIANALEKKLYEYGYRTYILDGDNIRHGLNKDLGFSNADRIENIRRVSEVSKLMVDAGIIVITSFISPFNAEREIARKMFKDDEFIEVFVDTPIDVIELRDPKGLYKKARNGELPNFTGIDSPYERPKTPDITVSTEKDDVNSIVKKIMAKIKFKICQKE